MKVSQRWIGLATVTAGVLLTPAMATAAFPNFSDCPLPRGGLGACVDIQSSSGRINIKGFEVPLGNSIEIRGGVNFDANGQADFTAPTGTSGFFAQPVDVPGGLLGIDLPIPGNRVTATAQLAGAPSTIRLDLGTLGVSMPLKLKLSNPLIGASCYIGSNASPVRLNLTVGTTNPPAPNRPISGAPGTPDAQINYTALLGNRHVDNSFAIPSASGCGYFGFGLIDTLINAKLKLPSAGGNNAIEIRNNLAITAP